MFNSTTNTPFGTSGDNDYLLVSHSYLGSDGNFIWQTAYNIRGNEVKHRRFYNGWQAWIS